MSPYGHQPPPPPPSPQLPPPPSPTPPYPHYDPPPTSPPYVPAPAPWSPPYVSPPTYPPYMSPPSYPPAPSPYYDSPPPPTPYAPVPSPSPYYEPAPSPYGWNSTGYTPPPPGHWHGGHILIVVLVPIAGLCLLGLLAGLLLCARRRRRTPEPECPPEEAQEVSEHVRVQEQVVCGPAGEVVVVDVLDEVIVQQEHGVVSHAHGRGEGPS